MKKIFFATLLFIASTNVYSQMLAWDFNGKIGSESFVVPGFADPDLQPTQIVRGALSGFALANSFNSDGWTTTNLLADAIANNSYYEFTVQANAGFTVSLAGISANFRRTSTGPRSFQWMYSLDGTNFTSIGSTISFNTSTSNGNAQAPIDLSAITALENVGSTFTITIRLYGYNAVNSTGQFALGRLFGNDLSITGTVAPIILSVRVISFNTVNNGSKTKLRWLLNCSSTAITFELQRGRNSNSFTSVYSQTATQARCASPFEFIDDFTPEGTSFYRLKMIDIDGKISYSKTLLVTNNKIVHSILSIVPNIVQDNATLIVPSVRDENIQLLLVNSLGITVKRMMVTLFSGTNNVSINTAGLTAGIYFVKIVMVDGKQSNAVMFKY